MGRAGFEELLRMRLDAVRERMKQAAGQPERPERVRQLRVALRRGVVALRVCAPVLPQRGVGRLRRRMNRVRRIAGQVRDVDVQIELLGAMDDGEHGMEGHADIARRLGRLRSRRCRRFERALRRRGPQIRRGIDRLLKQMRGQTAGEEVRQAEAGAEMAKGARALMPRLLVRARAAASADLASGGALHELRIACRRVRYALEAFPECMPERVMREIHPVLVQIQDELGKAGDLSMLARRVDRLARHRGERAGRKPQGGLRGQLEAVAFRARDRSEEQARKATALVRSRGSEALAALAAALEEVREEGGERATSEIRTRRQGGMRGAVSGSDNGFFRLL
jgi:CHAD domain-containing protein